MKVNITTTFGGITFDASGEEKNVDEIMEKLTEKLNDNSTSFIAVGNFVLFKSKIEMIEIE